MEVGRVLDGMSIGKLLLFSSLRCSRALVSFGARRMARLEQDIETGCYFNSAIARRMAPSTLTTSIAGS
jgi:hypothetical protein